MSFPPAIQGYEQAQLRRALERRFGASVLPLRYSIVRDSGVGPRILRVFDPETGSWLEGNVVGPRLKVVGEHDGSVRL